MDRLSIYLTLMTGAVLVGSLVIIAFTMGLYGWVPVLLAAAIGGLLTWPVSYLISRRIKKEDPGWNETRKDRTDFVPRPTDPEV